MHEKKKGFPISILNFTTTQKEDIALSLSLSLKKKVKTLTFLSRPGPVCLWKCEQIGSTAFYILNGWRKWEAQQAIENYILSCRCGGFFFFFFTPLKRHCFCISFFWLWLAMGNFCLAYILFYFLWADFFFFFFVGTVHWSKKVLGNH